jgi:ABC-type multidrug transport system permease subunit
MNDHGGTPTSARHYWPLAQLILARLREFYREPEAVFWVYGFPLLMIVALGIAFRNKPIEHIAVDVQQGPGDQAVLDKLSRDKRFKATIEDEATCRRRWKTGKNDVVVVPLSGPKPRYELLYDPTRPESDLARYAVGDYLQEDAGRINPIEATPEKLNEPGGRYIDFLVPGLLGMSLMGGGLWGVGFVIVDMRIRKLLKRFLATPMKKSQFLAAIMLSRLCFMIPEVVIVLIFSWLAFGVVIHGSLLAVLVLLLLGAFTFAGIGLLVASRARTVEAVSGLMNLVMLPMWVLSGIFFSSERFPDVTQPFIKVIPLTPLIDALRSVMLEGEPLSAQLPRLGILAGWGAVTFVLALRWFRWN